MKGTPLPLLLVVYLTALGLLACQSRQGEETRMQQQSNNVPCAAVPGSAPATPIDTVQSGALNGVWRDVEPALAAASKASAGVHKWAPGESGSAGAVFDFKRYRLGAGTCSAELEQMVAALFPNAAGDSAFKAEVRGLTAGDAPHIAATFDAWVSGGAEEERAVAALAERIGAARGRYPDLHLFHVKGASATARNAGVALVDPATREAVWYFARAVRMTADRR